MSTILSPNMSLPVPTVGTENGPAYANDINAALGILDAHTHIPGNGVPITPDGMNISKDLTFNNHNILNLGAMQLSQLAAASTVFPSLSVAPYSSNNELWYYDGIHAAFPITAAGAVNATLSSLVGFAWSSPAFVATQAQGSLSTTPAAIKMGNLILQPQTSGASGGSIYTTIAVNGSQSTAYTLTLPNNPSALSGTSFLSIDASGNMTTGPLVTGGITSTNLASSAQTLPSSWAVNGNGVGGGNIVSGTIIGSDMVANTVTVNQLSQTPGSGFQGSSYTPSVTGIISGGPAAIYAFAPGSPAGIYVTSMFGTLTCTGAGTGTMSIPIAGSLNFGIAAQAVGQGWDASGNWIYISPTIGAKTLTVSNPSGSGGPFHFSVIYQKL